MKDLLFQINNNVTIKFNVFAIGTIAKQFIKFLRTSKNQEQNIPLILKNMMH